MTSYRDAGVDLEGADRHVAAIGPLVTATWGDRVVGGFGGFAAGLTIPSGYRDPILMMTTDGVGTKLQVARVTGAWSGVGQDLVAMCADDLAAAGATPIGFVDYMAVGALDRDRDTAIVASIAEACAAVGAALVGGETAEHPGVMDADDVDLAGTALGIVERGSEIRPENVRSGDVIIGLPSPNLRSNGFSLVRRVFSGVGLDTPVGDEDVTLGDVLLRPSVLYAPTVLAAIRAGGVRGAAHVTGGGLVGNLPRTLPEGCGAVLDPDRWDLPEVFTMIADRGHLDEGVMVETFNLGIGFCLVVVPEAADAIVAATRSAGGRIIGGVVAGTGVAFTRPIL